uniref:Uncharacterized protein n=2 Tax=Setaria TaxID=4554 RepID=K4A4I4_SETIT|nr:hypothetical protein SEVIR_2G123750v2 [Setaria viridis]
MCSQVAPAGPSLPPPPPPPPAAAARTEAHDDDERAAAGSAADSARTSALPLLSFFRLYIAVLWPGLEIHPPAASIALSGCRRRKCLISQSAAAIVAVAVAGSETRLPLSLPVWVGELAVHYTVHLLKGLFG